MNLMECGYLSGCGQRSCDGCPVAYEINERARAREWRRQELVVAFRRIKARQESEGVGSSASV